MDAITGSNVTVTPAKKTFERKSKSLNGNSISTLSLRDALERKLTRGDSDSRLTEKGFVPCGLLAARQFQESLEKGTVFATESAAQLVDLLPQTDSSLDVLAVLADSHTRVVVEALNGSWESLRDAVERAPARAARLVARLSPHLPASVVPIVCKPLASLVASKKRQNKAKAALALHAVAVLRNDARTIGDVCAETPQFYDHGLCSMMNTRTEDETAAVLLFSILACDPTPSFVARLGFAALLPKVVEMLHQKSTRSYAALAIGNLALSADNRVHEFVAGAKPLDSLLSQCASEDVVVVVFALRSIAANGIASADEIVLPLSKLLMTSEDREVARHAGRALRCLIARGMSRNSRFLLFDTLSSPAKTTRRRWWEKQLFAPSKASLNAQITRLEAAAFLKTDPQLIPFNTSRNASTPEKTEDKSQIWACSHHTFAMALFPGKPHIPQRN